MQWKARWGAQRRDLPVRLPAEAAGIRLNQEGNWANSILSDILKRMPAFMVRASGELFYQYLA